MQPRLVLIDHDNCLTPTDGEVSSGFYEGLDELRQLFAQWAEQIPFGFCTGRDRNYVEAASFYTGLAKYPQFWSIIESGVALFNQATKKMLLNPALTDKVQEAFRKIRQERIPPILEQFPGLLDYPGNRIIITLERHQEQRSMEECYEVVKERLRDLEASGLIVLHPSAIAVDISPVGVDGVPIDKAAGVRFLGKVLGVDPSEMLGMGDSRGDFPMLNLVGRVGCPSNASQVCQDLVAQRGGHISRFPHSQGVADVIRHFLEGSS